MPAEIASPPLARADPCSGTGCSARTRAAGPPPGSCARSPRRGGCDGGSRPLRAPQSSALRPGALTVAVKYPAERSNLSGELQRGRSHTARLTRTAHSYLLGPSLGAGRRMGTFRSPSPSPQADLRAQTSLRIGPREPLLLTRAGGGRRGLPRSASLGPSPVGAPPAPMPRNQEATRHSSRLSLGSFLRALAANWCAPAARTKG